MYSLTNYVGRAWSVLARKACDSEREGPYTSFLLCRFMHSVTLTVAVSLQALYLPIWDDLTPNRPYGYRTRCNDLGTIHIQFLETLLRKIPF